ncbi:hypothetical protein OROGR_014401 [Orobanche gracilis]
MGLKNLHLKLKGIKLRRYLIGNEGTKSRKLENGKKALWTMHVSHGYHVVEFDESVTSAEEFESVVVQRRRIKDRELLFFGVFDGEVGEGITKYMQSHFFNKMPKETGMWKKCKEAMKMAHTNAISKLINKNEPTNALRQLGSASAMVIDGKKLVMANMGDYKAVICRGGEAYQISRKKQQPTRNWTLKLIPALGALRVPERANKSSELVVGSEKRDMDTEFVILASTGVWEVMRQQEAVNLVRHIKDPQAAAECLATEAFVRMSRSNIACLVIRFE